VSHPIKPEFPFINERLQRALDIQGNKPGTIAKETVATITAEDLTDAQFAWARRSMYFGASIIGSPGGGNGACFILAPTTAGFGQRKLARVRSISAWSVAASPVILAYGVSQIAQPLLIGSSQVKPTALDNRFLPKATAQQVADSAWRLEGGSLGGGVAAAASGWARFVAPNATGGSGNTAYTFDPLITLAAPEGGYLIVWADALTLGFGVMLSVSWEERDMSDQE